MELNKYQSTFEDLQLDSYPQEVQDEFMDAINSVPLIQHLISPNRPLAKDCPRDEKGRIIVDLTNPPIIEDTDYFRPVALFYKEHGKMTNLRPNANPNSEFGKWIREEIRRIWYGYVRESDGAWVTGDMYFYLNYCPIIQSKIRKGTKIADRIVDTPEFWEGIWWRSNYIEQARNLGHHCAEIAKRGASKSYFVASILAKLFILGENEDTSKSVRAMVTAYQKEYLVKDGTLNKFVEMIDYIAQNTEFPSKRLRSSLQDMQWKMGYVDLDTGTQRGTLNEIIGVSSKDDPDKLRGKRSSRIIIEEFGNFPKVTDTYRVILPSVQEGNIVFGQMILIGTGGSEGADFAGANEIIYNPLGFNIYAIPNVYDRSAQGKNNTIFFFGAYVNRKGCYNHDGVSNVTKALLELCYDRYLVKYNTTDSMALTRTKAENPITLQEAIMRRDSTLFPVATIMDRIHQIDGNPNEYDDVYVGELELKKDGKVEFKPTSAQPIRHFPHKDNKLEGAVEIFKMPELDRDGKPFNGRYIASQDPYDDDSAETMSLGSTFILDLWTDKIVAEYTGRPMFADDYYETSRRMCLFYNARMNYENNKKGLFAYFSKMNCLYLLTDVLEFLKDKDMVKGQLYGNKAKGTNATTPINAYARTLIRNWLLKPVVTVQVVDGEEQEVTVPNLMFIKSKALLQELAQWNPDGNFDRVSSLGMLMLLREDKMITLGGDVSKAIEHNNESDLSNDKFFKKNYDLRFKKTVNLVNSMKVLVNSLSYCISNLFYILLYQINNGGLWQIT